MFKINKKFIIIIAFLIAVLIAGVFAFYKYGKSFEPEATLSDRDNSFIQDIVKAPGVEGNIVNSGIAGIVVLADGRPFAAMLDIFKSGDMSKPIICVCKKRESTIRRFVHSITRKHLRSWFLRLASRGIVLDVPRGEIFSLLSRKSKALNSRRRSKLWRTKPVYVLSARILACARSG